MVAVESDHITQLPYGEDPRSMPVFSRSQLVSRLTDELRSMDSLVSEPEDRTTMSSSSTPSRDDRSLISPPMSPGFKSQSMSASALDDRLLLQIGGYNDATLREDNELQDSEVNIHPHERAEEPEAENADSSTDRNNEIIVDIAWDFDMTLGAYLAKSRRFLAEYRLQNSPGLYSVAHVHSPYRTRRRNSNDAYASIKRHYLTRSNKSHVETQRISKRRASRQEVGRSSGLFSIGSSSRRQSQSSDEVNNLQFSHHIPNVSWRNLPDYSPATDSITPDSARNLKINWKGSPIDLSHDPLRKFLHPAELELAETLRLPCDLYLDSKVRLFHEKVIKLRKGLCFRKTDAQKACKIDVNKASRLYLVYERAGWLKDENFTKFL